MNSETLNKIKNIISVMPEKPGVYQYFNKDGVIIYVGKAKNLKRRVSSYFNKNYQNTKTLMLVKHIYDLKYFIVESEEDALHLENSMIKEYQPKYNILLKDDKTYPWIVIKKEPFPRIFLTRTVIKDGSKYYGPYSNVNMAKVVLSLIKRLYPVRSCSYLLTTDKIRDGKYSKCLEYHIKNCNAPCVGLEDAEKYDTYIKQARQILNGETTELSNFLMEEMVRLSAELRFEEAQKIKEKYQLLENYRAKSIVVNSSVHNVDVFGYEDYEGNVYINYMNIRQGSIVQSMTISYKKRLDEAKEDILALGVTELRERFDSNAREVIVPFEFGINSANYTITVPQRGDKRHLLEISTKNAIQSRIDFTKQSEKLNPEQRATRILTQMAKDFRLNELPRHIECFDNSNIQGTNAVSACVVFKNAKPSKRDYRHFNVKTVVGANDYATMYEVIHRRYKRVMNEGGDLPQMIIVDGGKGQLSVAIKALKELGIYGKMAIVGIAERLEEIYFPNDSVPLYIDKNSESLKIVQYMRDEAHRFGITHHRKKRSKSQIASELDKIKGIGEKSKELLIRHFKSIKRVKEADYEDIAKIVGKSKAYLLKKGLEGDNFEI